MLKGKTTKELSREQLNELKWKLFSMDEGHEYAYVDEIFDEDIHRRYEGKLFFDEDFVSNDSESKSKELAIELHIYKPIDTNLEEGKVDISETFPEVHSELIRILEENGFDYQIYETEVREI